MKQIRIIVRVLAGVILLTIAAATVATVAGCDDTSMFHEFSED